MKYVKPELWNTVAAFAAIQSTTKGGTMHVDNVIQQTRSNPPAYEADE